MNKRPLIWTTFSLIMLVSRAGLACNGIEVSGGWIREPPPAAKVAAGYFMVENNSPTPVTIERVASSCCAEVAMHQSTVVGDQVRMSHMDKLVIPPHAATSFKPDGAHLMLTTLIHQLRHGETVNLEFFCTGGGSLNAVFDVARVR